MTMQDSVPDAPGMAGPLGTSRWVGPALAPLVLAGLVACVLTDPTAVFSGVGRSVANAVLLAALMVPLALVAVLESRSRSGAVPALLLTAGFLALTFVATGLPRLGPFTDLEWNWQGKLLDLVWVGIVLVLLARWARTRAGVRWRIEPGSLRPFLVVTGLFAAAWFGLTLLGLWGAGGAPAAGLSVERLLFDTTVPNLTEELIWRGLMLAVLDRCFGTPWRLAGAPVGWGLVLTAVLFGLGHGVHVEPGWQLHLLPVELVLTTLAGFVLGWVRARTGSIWPAYTTHCAPEVAALGATALWVAAY